MHFRKFRLHYYTLSPKSCRV